MSCCCSASIRAWFRASTFSSKSAFNLSSTLFSSFNDSRLFSSLADATCSSTRSSTRCNSMPGGGAAGSAAAGGGAGAGALAAAASADAVAAAMRSSKVAIWVALLSACASAEGCAPFAMMSSILPIMMLTFFSESTPITHPGPRSSRAFSHHSRALMRAALSDLMCSCGCGVVALVVASVAGARLGGALVLVVLQVVVVVVVVVSGESGHLPFLCRHIVASAVSRQGVLHHGLDQPDDSGRVRGGLIHQHLLVVVSHGVGGDRRRTFGLGCLGCLGCGSTNAVDHDRRLASRSRWGQHAGCGPRELGQVLNRAQPLVRRTAQAGFDGRNVDDGALHLRRPVLGGDVD